VRPWLPGRLGLVEVYGSRPTADPAVNGRAIPPKPR